MGKYAITGGCTGIGAALTQRLRTDGHEVLVVDIRDDADIQADLSCADGRVAASDALRKAASDGLDGFVPCAGVGPHVDPPDLVARLNYFGVHAITEGARGLLAQRRGAVVLISSNSAPMDNHHDITDMMLAGDEAGVCAAVNAVDPKAMPGQAAYASSKRALAIWMRQVCGDWAKRDGIRCNAVAPGYTETPMTDAGSADPRYRQSMVDFRETIPLGPAKPAQIASAVCFLLSEEASNCCGSVFFVDGGTDAMLRPTVF